MQLNVKYLCDRTFSGHDFVTQSYFVVLVENRHSLRAELSYVSRIIVEICGCVCLEQCVILQHVQVSAPLCLLTTTISFTCYTLASSCDYHK